MLGPVFFWPPGTAYTFMCLHFSVNSKVPNASPHAVEQHFYPPSHFLSPSVGMFISKIFSSTLNIIETSSFQRIKHRAINIYVKNMLAGVNKWVVIGSLHAAMIGNSYIRDIKWTVLINLLLAWYLWGGHSQRPIFSWVVFDCRGLLGTVSLLLWGSWGGRTQAVRPAGWQSHVTSPKIPSFF